MTLIHHKSYVSAYSHIALCRKNTNNLRRGQSLSLFVERQQMANSLRFFVAGGSGKMRFFRFKNRNFAICRNIEKSYMWTWTRFMLP